MRKEFLVGCLLSLSFLSPSLSFSSGNTKTNKALDSARLSGRFEPHPGTVWRWNPELTPKGSKKAFFPTENWINRNGLVIHEGCAANKYQVWVIGSVEEVLNYDELSEYLKSSKESIARNMLNAKDCTKDSSTLYQVARSSRPNRNLAAK